MAARRVDFHMRGNSFSRWKYRQVDCFIAASDAIRQMLVADGIPPSSVVTIHEGIDVERVMSTAPAAIHQELWLPTNAPIVGNVGALVPHKGQRYLVEAASLVLREVPDARFVVLGEGELRAALERQVAEAHLEKHVFLPGFRADVLAMHRAFDLFVMPSVTEGLGTSVLDAMAASKAVVATRAGGLPEVVVHKDTGFVVEPRDSRAMAAPIVKLLLDGGPAEEDGRRGAGARACPLQRRTDGGCDARHLRAAGAHTPRRGQRASFSARLKPHRFIIPRWQSAKSYFTGSTGSMARSLAVMSAAIRHPELR